MKGAALAYAQVRMQARHGRRAGEATWQPLLAIVEFRTFLEQARATSLQGWVRNISPISPLHELEQRLRGEFRRRVALVATWLPKPLRPAVHWSRLLIDLPILAYLLRREPLIGWMLEDEYLKPVAAADPEARAAALARTVYAPLAHGEGDLARRWVTEWRRLLGGGRTGASREIALMERSVREHFDAMRSSPVEEPLPARAAWALRRALERRFVRHFRAGFLQPAAVFAHLMLEALEFERLRGELVSRHLFVEKAG